MAYTTMCFPPFLFYQQNLTTPDSGCIVVAIIKNIFLKSNRERNHEYDYFDKVIEYEYDYFVFLTNVIEYEYDS